MDCGDRKGRAVVVVLPAMGAVVVVEETEVELAASRPAVQHTDATWLLYNNHPNDQRRVIISSIGRPMMDVRQIAAQRSASSGRLTKRPGIGRIW